MCQGGDQVLNKCCFSAETEAAPGCTLYRTGYPGLILIDSPKLIIN